MRRLNILLVGSLLTVAACGAQAQTTPAPANSAPKPAAKTAKPAAKKTPAPAAAKPAAETEGKISRRDPFESLTSRQEAASRVTANLPPGKAGLQVASLRLDGIVKAPNGMIAVVTNPQQRTYFLREGDQLYDGKVEKIALDGVSFHEVGKDAFGKPVERQVNKRIYSSAGEQQ
jgi:Tfp pilus assembly protein PilP